MISIDIKNLSSYIDPSGTLSTPSPSNQQNGDATTASKPTSDERSSSTEAKPKVTLEERVSRGEAQTGPTIPLVQVAPKDYEPSPNVRQVYPPLSEAEQVEQRKQAQLQANQPASTSSSTTTTEQKKPEGTTSTEQKQEEKKSDETTSVNVSSTEKKEGEKKVEITPEEEQKIVESVLKQLTPVVEQFVAAEIRRALRGQTDSDDENGFMPFPFMFGGGPMFAAPRTGPAGQASQQQSSGFPGGASFIPPELLMSMMNDFTQVGVNEGASNAASAGRPAGGLSFPFFFSKSSLISSNIGFMMFVDENPVTGGQSRNAPSFSGPRY